MKPENYPIQPAHLWQHFYEITQIPRPSRQEEAVRDYVVRTAQQMGYDCRTDSVGNLCVYVPATPGLQDRSTVIIQNHLDMVTVKSSDSVHDFERDPLNLIVLDGWLRADRTTLGADNGVGCAAALALMTDEEVERPPLELLFTVDEETGLNGALNLDAELLSGSRMLNLDTEDWQELFVGCAGGGGWEFRRAYSAVEAPSDAEFWRLSLTGLAGGHSGIQIHEQSGNAIKLLCASLRDVAGLRIAAVDIGVAHNVIPREGWVEFSCPDGVGEVLVTQLDRLREEALSYLPEADAALKFALCATEPQGSLSEVDSNSLLDLVVAFPHGALAYSHESPADLVDLSINFAILRFEAGQLYLESSYRFFNQAQSVPLQQAVLALARTFALEATDSVGYPGWQPDFASPLLAQARALHLELFEIDPAVKAIHAGLECGIIKSKKPDLDILSFGPTIRGAHSPAERLQIATVEPFWRFLTTLLLKI